MSPLLQSPIKEKVTLVPLLLTLIGLTSLGVVALAIFLTLNEVRELGPVKMAISGNVYYVDCNAAGGGNGSASLPWNTLKQVETATFNPGDQILFKRSCVWRGRLKFPASGIAGSPIVIDAYGSGSKPLFLASERLAWSSLGGNKWTTGTLNMSWNGYDNSNVGFILLGPEVTNPVWGQNVGKVVTNEADLKNNGEFWWDNINQRVILYTTNAGGPQAAWPYIEVGVYDRAFIINGKSYLEIKNIDARYGTGGSFQISNSHHITLDACEASYGGGTLTPILGQRAGDIIKIDQNSHDITIKNSKSSNAWESCLSVEAYQSNDNIYNITFENNIIDRCNLGIGINTPYYDGVTNNKVYNIYVRRNTITNSGYGWLPPNMASHGTAIWCFQDERNVGNLSNIYIEGNTIDRFGGTGIFLMDGGPYYIRKNIVRNGQAGYATEPYIEAILVHGGGSETTGDITGEIAFNLIYNNIRGLQILNNSPAAGLNIFNNTFYNNGSSNYANIHINYNSNKINFRNNIFYSGSNILLKTPYASGLFTSDYNLFYWGTGNLIDYGGTVTSDFNLYKNTLKVDSHSLFNQDPKFTDASKADFHLTSVSPLVNAGVGDIDGNGSDDLVGKMDLVGTMLPQGTTYDIGAYEYVPVCTPTTCSTLGKVCGTWSDGCGTNLNCGALTKTCVLTFGTCQVSGSQECNSNGQYNTCVATDPRVANCTNKQCGDDGCGGTCGTCTNSQTCNSQGQCVCSDNDSDGHLAKVCGGDDCNDIDAQIYPGKVEVCDSKDNNCNGSIDEGLTTTYYKDNDKDYWGNPNSSINSCQTASTYTKNKVSIKYLVINNVRYVNNKYDCNDNQVSTRTGACLTCLLSSCYIVR